MSRSRRNFSAEFKTNLVLQLLKGEKELNVLAVENDIQPNLLRNWKKEFLTNASLAFDNKREDNLREKLAEERKEKAEYAKKVGQLTMQVDWLKKNLKKLSDLTTRVNLVRNLSTTKELPVSTGAKLPGINRTSVYYGGIPVSEEDWNANLSLTICIRIILPGEPVRCLLNLNCADIRLDAVKQADICVKWTLHRFIQR